MTPVVSLSFPEDFKQIGISIASPEDILSWSNGEVINSETVNYRTFKPEMDGLFCEKIFGPIKDYECHCGKYKGIRYKGIICDRCGVEITRKYVRRERMGHIMLTVPIVHIWFFKSLPNKIAYLLDYSSKQIDKVVYYEAFVIVNPGKASEDGYKKGQFVTEAEKYDILEKHEQSEDLDKPFYLFSEQEKEEIIVIKDGAEALEMLLSEMDCTKEAKKLREAVKSERSRLKKAKILKRLAILESFCIAKNINRPEWVIHRAIPIIPPELRPLVPLEGGRFATSDINDLYRKIIIRNNRLKRLLDIQAPSVILRNEKRILQEAVDSLYENSRNTSSSSNSNRRPLKSLSDSIRGKSGRFRQNLLGKRVDYSGRSVIVVGPELEMHQCGLPKEMAIELYKPFVIRRLIDRGYENAVRGARKLIERREPVIWEILENVIQGRPVLLNRAPTLHRLGIQAYQPILIEEKAIRLHPLACAAFNADFDGDQMAVHVPLSEEAIVESMLLMLGAHNILNPANGDPITVPSQDMVLGIYYLTKARTSDNTKKLHSYFHIDDVIVAYQYQSVKIHDAIRVRVKTSSNVDQKKNKFIFIETTVGRVLFNKIIPEQYKLKYINETLGKKQLRKLIMEIYRSCGTARTAKFLDELKSLGFKHATLGGLSFNLEDIIVPQSKQIFIDQSKKEINEINERYNMGFITDNERYNQIIDNWTSTTSRISNELFQELSDHKDGFNPVYMMADSGARGSKEQIRQLGGIRGLMAKPKRSLLGEGSEIIETPILTNFKEGLSVLEYFLSTHGARKGLADTALKTADAGYLTRRLVDASQDIVINQKDCETLLGLTLTALKDNEDVIESLEDRILGRVSLHDIFNPITNELICEANQLIDEITAQNIANTSIDKVEIRSVLSCESSHGVCALCYGRDLARSKMVQIGEAVGVIAAQSIGEPGTQLTLRTFHVGGTSSRIKAESQHEAKFNGRISFDNVNYTLYKHKENDVSRNIVLSRAGEIRIFSEDERLLVSYNIPYGADLLVKENDVIEKGTVLCTWDPYNALIIAEIDGEVFYQDIVDGVTVSSEIGLQTGHREKVVIDSKDKKLIPSLIIKNEETSKIINIPVGAYLVVRNGEPVKKGHVMVKITRSSGHSSDITAGLPRVTELFESRSPSSAAVVSEIDGTVTLGHIKRNSREVIIETKDMSEQRKYLVPLGKHMLVQENDFVKAGAPLCEGAIAPQSILNILGPHAVQSYLVNGIQEVYRLQGVRINDKHIEVIVRSMMQKVEIEYSGDTLYLEGSLVDRFELKYANEKLFGKYIVTDPGDSHLESGAILNMQEIRKANQKLIVEGKKEVVYKPTETAISRPILLGITRTALMTNSWLSSASFQETTKVLTNAAMLGKKDYLIGLKENVIVGNKVPAGTGRRVYDNLIVGHKDDLLEEPQLEFATDEQEKE